MVDFLNHKGQACLFEQKLCQEGYCSECAICLMRVNESLIIEKESRVIPPLFAEFVNHTTTVQIN